MTIEQQDFLQEYLKDKPDFKCLIVKENENYNNGFYMINSLIENDGVRILSIYDYKSKVYDWTIARFILPQTYEQFKTIMDIFLGVENGNP